MTWTSYKKKYLLIKFCKKRMSNKFSSAKKKIFSNVNVRQFKLFFRSSCGIPINLAFYRTKNKATVLSIERFQNFGTELYFAIKSRLAGSIVNV